MERDNKLEKIMKENSLYKAPSNFTDEVIGRISGSPVPVAYRPIIGKRGLIIGLAIITFILLVAFIGNSAEASEPLLSFPEWEIPIPAIDWKIQSGLAAALIAVFVLLLSDAGLSRRKT